MKNRGLLSGDRHPCQNVFFAAPLAIIVMIMAAAAFCNPCYAAASGPVSASGTEETSDIDELQDDSSHPEKPEQGILILEEPKEKTRYAEYETEVGDVFSITFIHSVNKSPVTDFFEIREDGIYGIKTVYYGFGAGVPTELEEGQTLTYGEDGSMIITGMNVRMNNLIYRVGTVSDHILDLEDENGISLRELCGRNARVGFRFESN